MSHDEFADPVQPGMFKPEEWVQHLVLIEAQRYGDPVPTKYGPAGYVEARVHILSAPGGAQVIEQARLFGAFEGSTRSEIGLRPVIGRVESFVSQQSGRTGYRLGDATPQDREAASGYWAQWKAAHPIFAQPTAPVPNSQPMPQPQGYGPPTPQDQQWATQQQHAPQTPSPAYPYAPPGVTTNVVPAPIYTTAVQPPAGVSAAAPPAYPQPTTPAPQSPAPAPAQAPVPVPVTPAGPVAQAGAQAQRHDTIPGVLGAAAVQPAQSASSVPEMDDEQFAGMPEDVQKLLDAARHARLKAAGQQS